LRETIDGTVIAGDLLENEEGTRCINRSEFRGRELEGVADGAEKEPVRIGIEMLEERFDRADEVSGCGTRPDDETLEKRLWEVESGK
jgi:hypothetical protein